MIERETIKCKVEKIVYPRDTDLPSGLQFYIIKTDLGTVKGKLSWTPKNEERLSLFGFYKIDPTYGRFFEFASGRHDIPSDERSMLAYACELTKGIGEVTEKAIWEKLGDKWRELSVSHAIPRLTASAIRAFHDTIEHLGLEQEKLDAVSYLLSKGATVRMAESAWDAWQNSVISKVEADCYILAELKNFSFKDVDARISKNFGIWEEDPRRITAAVYYFMRQLSQSSTLVQWHELNRSIKNAIDANPVSVCNVIRLMFSQGRLVSFPSSKCLALDTIYECELTIFNYVSGACKNA